MYIGLEVHLYINMEILFQYQLKDILWKVLLLAKLLQKFLKIVLPCKTQYGLYYNNSNNKVFVLAVTEEGNILSELDGTTDAGTIIFGEYTWIKGGIIYISK